MLRKLNLPRKIEFFTLGQEAETKSGVYHVVSRAGAAIDKKLELSWP